MAGVPDDPSNPFLAAEAEEAAGAGPDGSPGDDGSTNPFLAAEEEPEEEGGTEGAKVWPGAAHAAAAAADDDDGSNPFLAAEPEAEPEPGPKPAPLSVDVPNDERDTKREPPGGGEVQVLTHVTGRPLADLSEVRATATRVAPSSGTDAAEPSSSSGSAASAFAFKSPGEKREALRMKSLQYKTFKGRLSAFGTSLAALQGRAARRIERALQRRVGGQQLLAGMKAMTRADSFASGKGTQFKAATAGGGGKKTFLYKLKSSKRRIEQRVLETTGAVQDKVEDAEFERMWGNVQTQRAALRRLAQHLDKYKRLTAEGTDTLLAIADDLTVLCSGQEASRRGSDAPVAGLDAVLGDERELGETPRDMDNAFKARSLKDAVLAIKDAVVPAAVDFNLDPLVVRVVEDRAGEFPSYDDCVRKRQTYARDLDAYVRKAKALGDAGLDNDEARHKRAQLATARERYERFNAALKAELAELDATRFSYANELVEGLHASLQILHEKSGEALGLSRRDFFKE